MARLENKLRRTVEQVAGWDHRAECREADPEMFFPDVGDVYAAAAAKALCGRCPVQVECRTFALENPDLAYFGVWGGLSQNDRWEHPDRRPLGRWETRERKPCGTPAAFRRHLRNDERPCEACRRAKAVLDASPDGKRGAA